jgi:hypothetical protein
MYAGVDDRDHHVKLMLSGIAEVALIVHGKERCDLGLGIATDVIIICW